MEDEGCCSIREVRTPSARWSVRRLVLRARSAAILLHDLVKHIQSHFLDLSACSFDLVPLLKNQEMVHCVRDGNLIGGYLRRRVNSALLWLD